MNFKMSHSSDWLTTYYYLHSTSSSFRFREYSSTIIPHHAKYKVVPKNQNHTLQLLLVFISVIISVRVLDIVAPLDQVVFSVRRRLSTGLVMC